VREGIIRPIVSLLPEDRTTRLGNYGRLAKKFVFAVDRDLKRSWQTTVSYLPSYAGAIFTGEFASIRRENYGSDAFERHWAAVSGLSEPLDQVTYVDMKMYMVDQLLMQQDKMSMAVSLEARVPFLDYRLVELAASIPMTIKLPGGRLKSLLKTIAEKHIPRECIYREKKGFGAPIERWLRGPLRERLLDALSPRRVRERGLFEVEFIEWLKREFFERGRDFSVQLYQILLLEIWLRLYADGGGRRFLN
jgi:asparagine synthase (glutamine-hydrolysing)